MTKQELRCMKCGHVHGVVEGNKINIGEFPKPGGYLASAPAEIKCMCGMREVWFGEEEDETKEGE